jgi:hypothetical protein
MCILFGLRKSIYGSVLAPKKRAFMPLGVSALLHQLSTASQILNEASDSLTQEIKETETALGAFNLGVSSWVVCRSTPEIHDLGNGHVHDLVRLEMLGYAKHHGKWALLVSSGIEEVGNEETWLLRDAPRDLRILAVDYIPQLLEKIAEDAAMLAATVRDKAAKTQSVARSIRKPNKAGE